MGRIPVAMSIAGSDSGGGAGIQADLKTFSALGVYGTTAITSITAQNTLGVTAVHDIPGEIVYEQIKVVVEDIGVDAAKTGMLSNSNIILNVAKAVKEYSIPLVVDPVMIAKSGARLLREDAAETLTGKLLPLALIVTPNAMEAEVLSGIKVNNVNDAEKAAKLIVEKYKPKAVVVKGGHIKREKVVDVLYYNGNYYHYESEVVSNGCFHGGGCSHSAAITAYIAKGYDLIEAVGKALEFVTQAIKYGLKVGKGHCPVNPVAWIEIPAEKYRVLADVNKAIELLLENSDKILPYVPEVGMNIVETIDPKYASTVMDIAGVRGRIVKAGNKIIPVGPVEYGASRHLAKLVLEALKHNSSIRAAINIKYDEKIIEKAKDKGYTIVYVDRRLEPEEVKSVEGASIQWITHTAFTKAGKTPDLIYDTGDVGKEPMIRIIGKNAIEVVDKLLNILP